MEEQHDDAERIQQEQQTLVDSSLSAMFQAYDDAKSEGLETPAVLVLDCEDPLGAALARGLVGDEVVDDAIAEQEAEADGSVTVFAAALSWVDCRERTVEGFPYLSEAFEQGPPDDGFLAIGVTAGGASAFTAPFDARPDE